jgi:hypothetical protein
MSRQFNAPYTANLVPNTAHILRFTLCELWSRPYRMYLQLLIFRLQYSSERICAAISDISLTLCALHCKHGAKYRADPPVYAIWTVVPNIYRVVTSPHIQSSVFNWTYLRSCWRYLDDSMRVILQIWWQIQRTPSSLRYVNCGHGHIQSTYSSVYSGFTIQQNLPALLLEVSRQFNERYTAIFVPNTAHVLRFKLCQLWSRPYTM